MTMHDLATAIAIGAAKTQRTIAKQRLEAEWKTKRRPQKAQEDPSGMFVKTQGHLFDR